ncbi:site-specific DNA-methyltransferase [Pseudoclavibacter sp. CFCC 14310]|nr:site-specific DNA-methyltransferase [Pseudoclavibacter sp. CFCC 14310]KAB1646090.1 site-specific DNA-methyltransferase [Pseudoclavibacter sp. CFCC 14310]
MGWCATQGDCRQLMRELDDSSVDVIITDPPYEIGQTQKPGLHWDDHGIAFDPDVWEQCARVLKPGGHLAAFGASKTYHRLACAIEDAGLVVRDQLMWLYASGMTKGLSFDRVFVKTGRPDLAHEYAGTHSRLKPAHEPICLAGKPFATNMPDGVAQWGTGTLQIDQCRVPTDEKLGRMPGQSTDVLPLGTRETASSTHALGRFPTNAILVDDGAGTTRELIDDLVITGRPRQVAHMFPSVVDQVFYASKAAKSERPTVDGAGHLTVKPRAVMRWLVSLLVRPGQVVLDPFCGSGTTLQAADELGAEAIGFDLDPHSIRLVQARMSDCKARD